MPAIKEARAHGQAGFTLDFYAIRRAWPEAMLPLIAQVDWLRRQRLSFNVMLPADRRLNRLFLNANWAHLLAPSMFDPGEHPSDRHMPAQRYGSGEEQKRIVDMTLEILLGAMQLDRQILRGLEWSLNEITDNVLNHASAPEGGLVQVTTLREHNQVRFVVCDSGRGIPASMREGYPHLKLDIDAIGEAIKQGVTRSSDAGQGNGLAGALRIATLSGGRFRVMSARGELTAKHPPDTPEYRQEVHGRPKSETFHGTCVAVQVHTAMGLDLDEALNFSGGHSEWDYIDAEYAGDRHDIELPLAKETVGFGSRTGGRSMRVKALNLLDAEPQARLALNWDGVPSISSSFADEFIGRLFVDLGPTVFMARVRLVGVEPLVQKLVDRAIMQRAGQSV